MKPVLALVALVGFMAMHDLSAAEAAAANGISPSAVDTPFNVGVAQIFPQPTARRLCQVIQQAGQQQVKLLSFAEGIISLDEFLSMRDELSNCIQNAGVNVVLPVSQAGSQSAFYITSQGITTGCYHKDMNDFFVVDMPDVGRVCTLLAEEAWVVLARYTYYTQNCQFLVVPAVRTGPVWSAKMKSIGREGRMYVLSVGALQDTTAAGQEGAVGGAIITNPWGQSMAGPVYNDPALQQEVQWECGNVTMFSPQWAHDGCCGNDVFSPTLGFLTYKCGFTTLNSVLVPGAEFILTASVSRTQLLMDKTYQDNVGNYHTKWAWDVVWLKRQAEGGVTTMKLGSH